jgi:hypothetical protein
MLDLVRCRHCGVHVPRSRIKKHNAEWHAGEPGEPVDRMREAYQRSDSPLTFVAALQDIGMSLAVVSKEEAKRSEREVTTGRRTKEMKEKAVRAYEIVAVSEQAQVYKLTERTTGDSRAGIETFLAELDRASLQGLDATKRIMQGRAESRDIESPRLNQGTPPYLAQRLPFVLLPPGQWDIGQVVEHYRRVSHSLPACFGNHQIDWTRLEDIGTLNPVRCHIGEESWLGYVVFEFGDTDRVVLECPIEGNATYILSGDWKETVYHTKAEVRCEFAGRHQRIVHKGTWLLRVRNALRRSRDVA